MENEQQPGEQNDKPKPTNSEHINDQVEASPESRFQLKDLPRLTFETGNEADPRQVLDCWSASVEQFAVFIRQFGDLEDDVNDWGPFDRLEYVNDLWEYCEANAFAFPFTINSLMQPVMQAE